MASPYDLRSFLAEIDADLIRVSAEVSPRFEVSAVLQAAETAPVLFESVSGYPGVQVVGNLLGSRELTARALRAVPDRLAEVYVERTISGIPPVLVSDPPVQEVVIEAPSDVSELIPIPTYHERDAGPFLTCGVVIARNHQHTGMGIHRMMFKGGNQFGIYLANPPIATFLDEAEARGEGLEVAVALGVDPATLIAAVVRAGPQSPEKTHIAGALRGAPLELAPALTIGLAVPARAEVVLEGRLKPGVREMEGPFGENTGFYFSNLSPVFEATAVTHRHDPIIPALRPWGPDVDSLLSLAAGAELLAQLRGLIPGVADLELTAGSCGFAAVISVGRLAKSDVRRLIHLSLALDRRLKQVTVVRDEVDVRDPRQVAWAMATHYRPDRDTVILEGMESYVIDPTADAAGKGANVGFDATGEPSDTRERVAVPSSAMARAQTIMQGSIRREGK